MIWIFTEGEGAWDQMEAIFFKKDAFKSQKILVAWNFPILIAFQ